jgi:LPS O-antigen subunit length determinant protein (WzzB/FepE family)
MQNKNPDNHFQEDTIDLKEIFKICINSKKLIIVITLVITTLGAIYSFQKKPIFISTALIEIGNYNLDEYNQISIEPLETLIKELTINFIHKKKKKLLNIKSIENRLVQTSYTSASSVKNINILNEALRFIENRHSLLMSDHFQKTKKQLTYKINILNNKIQYSKSTLLSQNEGEKIRISNSIESLENQIRYSTQTLLSQNEDAKIRISREINKINIELPGINEKIESLKEIIFKEKSNLLYLKSDNELYILRLAQAPTLDQVIHSYLIKIIDYENKKISLLNDRNNLAIQLKNLEDGNIDSGDIFELTQEKDNLEIILNLLESYNGNNLDSDQIFKLTQEKNALELELKPLESADSEFLTLTLMNQLNQYQTIKDEVFKLTQEKEGLELELEFLMDQNPNSTQLIGEIVTKEISTKKSLIISLSFIFGLFLSIIMIFINYSLKAFKEE